MILFGEVGVMVKFEIEDFVWKFLIVCVCYVIFNNSFDRFFYFINDMSRYGFCEVNGFFCFNIY